MGRRLSRSHSEGAPMLDGASRRRSPLRLRLRRQNHHHRHRRSYWGRRRLRPPHYWCHRSVARVRFPLRNREQKLPSQLAVSSAPPLGGSAAGDARQARNISSYTKTTQQRENGPSVPWVLTKFRRNSTRTRQSLFIPSAECGCFLRALHRARSVRLGTHTQGRDSCGDSIPPLLSGAVR